MKKIDYELLEKKIGYTFKDKSLMKTALTHKTFAFEADLPLEYSERLEFFGDSVLNFIVSDEGLVCVPGTWRFYHRQG